LEQVGFLTRLGVQYHWNNNGYGTFDDFLAALNSRKRKAVRKETRGGRGVRARHPRL
jgi:predicted N-acyltransferase